MDDRRAPAAAEQRLFEAVCEAFDAYQNATADEKEVARERYANLLERFSQMIRPNTEKKS